MIQNFTPDKVQKQGTSVLQQKLHGDNRVRHILGNREEKQTGKAFRLGWKGDNHEDREEKEGWGRKRALDHRTALRKSGTS